MPLYASTGAFNVAVNDTTGTGRYSASGALRINLVTGSSYVGLYAADGALNVVDVSGVTISTYGGLYHPSGAIRGRTAPTTYSGIQAPDGSYYFNGLFTPLNLFAAGEQGLWYDPSDLSTMFQDSAGTIPVTAVEQPVGKILDKSGRGNHATQSTAGSQPVLSAKVNILNASEDFSNASWTKGNTAIVVNQGTAPNGTLTADLLYPSTTGTASAYQSLTAPSASLPLTASCCFKASGIGFAYIQMNGTGGTVVASAITIDLSTGTRGTIQALAGGGILSASAAVENLGDGWYRLTLSGILHSSNTGWGVYFGPSDAQNTRNVTASGTNGILAFGADLRVTNFGINLPVYQRVTTSADYDTFGFPMYLRFDGTDDSLATGTINPGSVDKAQVFAGVRKLSDTATATIVELSNGTGFNDAFALQAETASAYRSLLLDLTPNSFSTGVTPSSYAAPITNVVTGIYDRSLATAATENVLRINSVQQSLTFSVSGVTDGNFGSYPLYIGRRGGTSNPFNGYLYGLIVRFSAANLSAARIASAEAWVNGQARAS